MVTVQNFNSGKGSSKALRIAFIASTSAAVIALICAGYFGYKYNLAKSELAGLQKFPANNPQSDILQLIAKVGSLIILPVDEQPTVATVNDLTKLKDQPFFANAQIGDRVLIYSKAKKAILYRPSSNKIIELAPLTDSPASVQNQVAP